jgi:hypothetical protein
VLVLCAACGKKGPPLAPLNMGPEAPPDLVARRLGDTVYLQMKVPAKSLAGRGPYSVDHLEVYAVTVAPGIQAPSNAYLLKPAQIIGKIPVRPPQDPDAPEPSDEEKAKETRPAPGDAVTFLEKLTDAQLEPKSLMPKARAKDTNKTKGAKELATAPGAAAAAAPVGPPVLTRMYVVRGVAKNGNAGAPSVRANVPLLAPPGRVRPGAPPSWSESAITVNWAPPPSNTDEVSGVLYNVYAAPPQSQVPSLPSSPSSPLSPSTPIPLNSAPLEATSFTYPGAAPGKEQCFVVRTVAAVGTTFIEGDASDPICVTPKDTFPPAAPKGLTAVGDSGAVNLVWDSNTETDLAGYLVLRGEAPGDRLQALMADPIRDNRYVDRTVKAGVTYVYTIVAVDKAGNRSAPSTRVQETAR